MQIRCPQCNATHDVPMDALPTVSATAPPTMRCAKCKSIFAMTSETIKPPAPVKKQRLSTLVIRLLILGIFALLVGFLVFVAEQNSWALSFSRLPEQVDNAFFGNSGEHARASAAPLVVTVYEGSQLKHKDKDPILVVRGEVLNPADIERTHILLEGQIVEKSGKVAFEAKGPCGKIYRNRKLRKTSRNSMNKLWTKSGELHNCKLQKDKSAKFQLVFDNIPADYSEEYTIRVKATHAGQKSSLRD
jgi:hypothetical protein